MSKKKSLFFAVRADVVERYSYWFFLISILAVGFYIRWRFLNAPLERDEGEYATIAWMSSLGYEPYRDAFDQKTPAIFWLYKLAFSLFSEGVHGIRKFTAFYTLVTVGVFSILAKQWLGRGGAILATLSFALVTLGLKTVQGHVLNTELAMLLPLLVALIFFTKSGEKEMGRMPYFVSGFFSGLALMIKLPGVFNAVFLALVILVGKGGFKKKRHDFIFFTVGCLIVPLGTLFYFLYIGTFPELWDATYLHNRAYAASFPWSDSWIIFKNRISLMAQQDGPVWLAAIVGALLWCRKREGRAFLLLGWCVASVLGIIAQRYFRGHYFLQVLPGVALFAGAAYEPVKKEMRKYIGPALFCKALSLLLCGGFIMLGTMRANAYYWFRAKPTKLINQIYGQNPFTDSLYVARRISQETGPNDRVFVLGSEPQIYFYTRRLPASRYIFLYPLTGSFSSAQMRQQEAWEDIQKSSPAYVVKVHIPWSIAVATTKVPKPDYSQFIFKKMSWYLSRYYEEDGAVWRTSKGMRHRYGLPSSEDPGEDSLKTLTLYRRKNYFQ